ncbi:MAG: DUF5115 domain-containing protein [Bacteroides sp.]
MKKVSVYLLSLFTLAAVTACDENFEDWAAPQTNEPEAAKSLSFDVATASAAFDLATIQTDSIDLLTQTKLSNEAGTLVSYDIELDKAADFAAKLRYSASLAGTSLKMATADLQKAVETLYGKRPEARPLIVRVNAYVATPKGQTSKVRSSNLNLKITPKAPIIEPAYYLIGNMNNWVADDATKLIKLNHSGKDVYEDAEFSILLKVSEKCYWKVIPQSCVDALKAGTAPNVWGPGVLGCAIDGDTAEEGRLVVKDAQAMQIAAAGWVRITLNLLDGTYQAKPMGEMSPYLWTPGNHQGWAPDKAVQLYSANMDMVYNGHLYLNGGFKLTGQPSWTGVDYGFGFFTNKSNNITDDGGNLVVPEGFYFLKADMTKKSIEAVKTEWSLIGGAVGGWDPANDVMMKYDPATNCWSVTTDLAADQLKFRANKDWGINMGGSPEKLVSGGDNLKVTQAGNYTVKLYLTNDATSHCTLTKN